jgi:hypothetical protein
MRIVALFLVIALAGCLGGDDGTENDQFDERGPDSYQYDGPFVDATAAKLAGEASANIELLGTWEQSGAAEVDIWSHYMAVMRGGDVHILDISNASAPVEVSIITETPRVLDVKWSDDGAYLFIGDDTQATTDETDDVTGRTGGFYVVNTTDLAAPRLVSYLPIGPLRGPHMVDYFRASDGREIIMGANADVSLNVFDRATETLTEVARYAPNYVTDVARTPDTLDVLYQLYAHDMFAMQDEILGDVMYVANWDAGMRIVDINDPANPVELGAWNDFPAGDSGNIHTVSTEWIGEQRITVASAEIGFAVVGGVPYVTGTEQAVDYVLDTTDPTDIKFIGRWENPEGLTAGRSDLGEPLYSTHNMQLEGGLVYLAHYQLGVWVYDPLTLETLGYFSEPGWSTWDVVLRDGVMWTAGGEGVHSLHFLPDFKGPGGLTSRA